MMYTQIEDVEHTKMRVEHIELLQIERDLHNIPRGMERFQAYLQTLVNEKGDDVALPPLVAMNPMGREHVSERLDELIDLGAEAAAHDAVRQAEQRLSDQQRIFKHGLVVCDDVHGGWTNRYTNDAASRFPDVNSKWPRGNWLTTILWVSDTPTWERVNQAVLMTLCRVNYLFQHGTPKTLADMLKQEGQIAAFAGQTPQVDPDEIDYSRHVIEPYHDSTDYAVHMAAMYGDEAARSLGYEPLGLSPYAGFAVALADAQKHLPTQPS